MSRVALRDAMPADVLPGAALEGTGVPSRWLGRVPFAPALELQEELRRRYACVGDLLLLLEHEPVYTTGRGGRSENLAGLATTAAAVPVERIGRGGDVTYHGPGQLVGYALVDLRARDRDVHRFLRQMETGVIWTLRALGVRAVSWPGRTGVWVVDQDPSSARAGDETDLAGLDDHHMQHGKIRKIASIGVGVRGGITMHGFALNVALDLAPFAAIVPCGLAGVHMTTIEREATIPIPSLREVAALAARHVGGALAWPYPRAAMPGEQRA